MHMRLSSSDGSLASSSNLLVQQPPLQLQLQLLRQYQHHNQMGSQLLGCCRCKVEGTGSF
jgi:hypothetical protein